MYNGGPELWALSTTAKMTANREVRLSLAMAPLLLVSFASASQYTTTETCNFTFSLGDLPNFRLPEAGPNSPGDVQLNAGNGIITEGWLEGDSEYCSANVFRCDSGFVVFFINMFSVLDNCIYF